MPSTLAAEHSFFSSRGICIVLVILGVILLQCASAQGQFTRIQGTEDQSVPMPTFVGALGQKDARALQEFVDYLKAVNIFSWKGMQASGTLTDSLGNADPATLTIVNGDQFRLDVQKPRGERSTRISGSYGKTLEVDGKSFSMVPATARAGLLAFPQLLVATFPTSNTSFIDRGLVQIGGGSFHRITLEELAFTDATAIDSRNINVTDLYFDPSSHLLLKSASAVQLDSADREQYLIVVTYSNYENVQGTLIPCTYSQSMNGQPQWTLRLNSPSLQPSVDSTYFYF
ncbi:MAG: hypothetical protein ACRD3F_02460 [Acidobacteriaceae bacterium]